MTLTILPIQDSDRPWVAETIRREWHGDEMVAHGEVFLPAELPGLIAWLDGARAGLLTYRLRDNACEITSLDSFAAGHGIGLALVHAVRQVAVAAGCTRLWLVTTNDNLHALGFYQRRGFRLVRLDPGAVERARRLKPSIPELGLERIPLRDELELEIRLD